MTSQQMISEVANEVGDPGFEFLKKNEHIQFMNDTRREMGLLARCFHSVTDKTDLTTNEFTYPLTDQDVIKLDRVEYYFSGVDTPLPMHEKAFHKVNNELYYPSGNSYEWLSQTTTYEDDSGNVVLTITSDTTRGEDLKPNWYSTRRDNGLLTLYFPFKFSDGDWLKIYYYSAESDHSTFDDIELIWDPFVEVIREGMRWRALRRLGFRRDTNDPKMWVYTKEAEKTEAKYYNKLLPWLKRFMTSLGTESDVPEMQAFKYP